MAHENPHSFPFTQLPRATATAIATVSLLLAGKLGINPRLLVLDAFNGADVLDSADTKTHLEYPVLVFLVEKLVTRADGTTRIERALFDLGVRKDPENFRKEIKDSLPYFLPISNSPDIIESLASRNLSPSDISTVFLSHDHFDHIGDPSLFPESTQFIVGDFSDPNEESELKKFGHGRRLRKLFCEDGLKWVPIGSFDRALDFYGDGSFWIINAPGHCHGHIMALAQTSIAPPSYILMAADSAHDKCLYSPCPRNLTANDTRLKCGVYGTNYETTAVTDIDASSASVHENLVQAYETIARVSRMEGEDGVFVIAAHEREVAAVIGVEVGGPKVLNGWLQEGVKTKVAKAMQERKEEEKNGKELLE